MKQSITTCLFVVVVVVGVSGCVWVCLTTLPSSLSQTEKKPISDEKKADQKALDAQLLPLISAVPQLSNYMSSYFSLGKGLFPHELKF